VHLSKALAANARDVRIHGSLANILSASSRMDQALHHIEAVVALESLDVRTRTHYARLLATLPDASLRDGAQAVHYAPRQWSRPTGTRPSPSMRSRRPTLRQQLLRWGRLRRLWGVDLAGSKGD
jgi:hypothetical protein